MEKLRRLVRRRTNLLLLACTAFLAGLAVAKISGALPIWLGLLAAPLVIVFFVKKRFIAAALVVAVCSFCFGVWRGATVWQGLAPYRNLAGKNVSLKLTANEDAVYGAQGQLNFVANSIEINGRPVGGTMKVKGFGELAVYKGDRLEVQGKLYQTRGASQAGVSFAKIHRIGSHDSWLDHARRRFSAGIQTALPEPAASFGMGLLVGQRNTLPEDVTTSLRMVGLTHIIAVSGYNLTIIVSAVRRSRLLKRLPKFANLAVAVTLMLGFISLTGGSASIIRAAVVSGLALAAWYFGRTVRPMVLILLAAALTAAWNPIYLWSDIGWYLSFLAFFGILVIAPKLQKLFWRNREAPMLGMVAVETVSAEIMTIPLIMQIFGQISLIGLAANVLVVSLIPLAMLFCLIAGLAGWFLPMLAGWVSWPARILLTYMLDVAMLLSKIPNVFLENRYISTIDMVLCYVTIGVIALGAAKKRVIDWTKQTKLIANRQI